MKKNFGLIILIGIFSLFIQKISAEQNEQIIITWQANNFYPSDYLGKALASSNTPIIISAEILKNGKISDSSKTNFLWYVDNELINQGFGFKETSFIAKKTDKDSYFVRVVAESNGKKNENSIRIPTSENKLIIQVPYPNQLIKAGSRVALKALPYFFNVSSLKELNFTWQINEKKYETGDDNQLILNLGTPKTSSQNEIQISVFAQNQKNKLEFKESKTKLSFYE